MRVERSAQAMETPAEDDAQLEGLSAGSQSASSPSTGRPRGDRRRLWGWGACLLLAIVVFLFVGDFFGTPKREHETQPLNLIDEGSYWATPLPENAPVDPDSDEMIDFMRENSTTDYIRLAGTGPGGLWGNPIYWAKESDRAYSVQNSCSFHQPPEFQSVRIPAKANADPTSDASMTVYDPGKNLVYGFWRTKYDSNNDVWTACGGTVHYLDSNGLTGSLEESDEPRNSGHRGLPPITYAVRLDEIRAGTIDHVLRVAISPAGMDHVFPMTGSDGDSADPFAPPEGARLRLKPDIDLYEIELSGPQRTIATALQDFGAVIGDQSSGPVSLKVENTVAQGEGQLWKGLLSGDSLSTFSLQDFEFVTLGFGR